MTTRRSFMAATGLGAVLATLGVALFGGGRRAAAGPTGHFPLELSDADWQKRLTPAQYRVLREAGTERPFTSPLNDEHRNGVFACAGCATKAFKSETKFDSGTGWPSFFAPISGAVAEETDSTLGMRRTEVHCAHCGGHLGHVFEDGPQPTGLRYCMNGVALQFQAA